jgi:hypothetical protein
MDQYHKNLIDFIIKKAEQEKENAAFSGCWSDGGYQSTLDEISIWKAGLEGKVPKEWSAYVRAFRRETDPEYKDYIRLKDKFD